MRSEAIEKLDKLRNEHDLSDKEILEYLIYNYMSGYNASEALDSVAEEYDISLEEEEEEEEPETCDECGEELDLDGECQNCNESAGDED
jgi:hypothetical protein